MALVVGTNAYQDAAGATTYFDDTLRAARWTAVVATQDPALIDATAWLDRLTWVGDKTAPAPGQLLDWPRTGVTNDEGEAIPSGAIPGFIEIASSELALMLAEDPTIIDSFFSQSGSNIKRVKAGDVEVQFFEQIRASGNGTLSDWLFSLIGQYLASSEALSGGLGGAFASGLSLDSFFVLGTEKYGKTEGFP